MTDLPRIMTSKMRFHTEQDYLLANPDCLIKIQTNEYRKFTKSLQTKETIAPIAEIAQKKETLAANQPNGLHGLRATRS